MALTDFPLDQLRSFRPEVAEPEDFDEFWARTLSESRALAVEPSVDPVSSPITEVIVEDLTFSGFAGERIRGWIIRPRADSPRPAVVEYIGYNGGRGVPSDHLRWAASGYVHVVMDTRGQGSGWGSGGHTPDPHGSEPAVAGFMTRGIARPDSYFYRRVFTDAALLLDAVKALPFVDETRLAVTGVSQGGGISLAAAGLHPDVHAVMPDVPYLCHFRRSASIATQLPFKEIERYLSVHRDRVDAVFDTLSYFDGVNFARRVCAPAFFSVALMDEIVPPSGVFAAFNHCSSPDAEIEVYEFNGHEGGQSMQWARQAEWLRRRL